MNLNFDMATCGNCAAMAGFNEYSTPSFGWNWWSVFSYRSAGHWDSTQPEGVYYYIMVYSMYICTAVYIRVRITAGWTKKQGLEVGHDV